MRIGEHRCHRWKVRDDKTLAERSRWAGGGVGMVLKKFAFVSNVGQLERCSSLVPFRNLA